MILADVGTPWTLGGTSDPGFADAIRQYALQGGVVYGGSAGPYPASHAHRRSV